MFSREPFLAVLLVQAALLKHAFQTQVPLLTDLQQLRNHKDTSMAKGTERNHYLQRLRTLPQGPQRITTSEQQAPLSYTTTHHEWSQTKRLAQRSILRLQNQQPTTNPLPTPRALRRLLPRRRQLQRRRRRSRLRRLSRAQQPRCKDHDHHHQHCYSNIAKTNPRSPIIGRRSPTDQTHHSLGGHGRRVPRRPSAIVHRRRNGRRMPQLRHDGNTALAARRARPPHLQRLRPVPQAARLPPAGPDEEVDD